MNILKSIAAILVAGSLALFCSCQKAPEEVKKENSILDNVESKSDEKKELEFQTMKEIRSSSENTLKNNKTNVTIDHLILSQGDTMPAYKIKPFDTDYDKLKPIVKYVFNEDFSLNSPYCEYTKGTDKVNLQNMDGLNGYDILVYHGKNDKKGDKDLGLRYHETGKMWCNLTDAEDPYRFVEYFTTKKMYKIREGDKLDSKNYTMVDNSKWNVKDSVDFAQNFVDKYFTPLENNNFSYKPTEVKLKKFDNKYGFIVEFQRADKQGNLFDNHWAYCNSEIDTSNSYDAPSANSWLAKGYPYLYGSCIEITLNKKNKINSFEKEHVPYFKENVNDGKKLLSLKSAIDIISSTLATDTTYNFETCELEYYYVALDDPKWKKYYDMEAYMLRDADVQARPYWAFTKSDCWPEQTSDEQEATAVNENSLYLVDAITGKLYIF